MKCQNLLRHVKKKVFHIEKAIYFHNLHSERIKILIRCLLFKKKFVHVNF